MTVYKNFKNPSQMTEKEQQELGGKAVGAVITFFLKPFIEQPVAFASLLDGFTSSTP